MHEDIIYSLNCVWGFYITTTFFAFNIMIIANEISRNLIQIFFPRIHLDNDFIFITCNILYVSRITLLQTLLFKFHNICFCHWLKFCLLLPSHKVFIENESHFEFWWWRKEQMIITIWYEINVTTIYMSVRMSVHMLIHWATYSGFLNTERIRKKQNISFSIKLEFGEKNFVKLFHFPGPN